MAKKNHSPTKGTSLSPDGLRCSASAAPPTPTSASGSASPRRGSARLVSGRTTRIRRTVGARGGRRSVSRLSTAITAWSRATITGASANRMAAPHSPARRRPFWRRSPRRTQARVAARSYCLLWRRSRYRSSVWPLINGQDGQDYSECEVMKQNETNETKATKKPLQYSEAPLLP